LSKFNAIAEAVRRACFRLDRRRENICINGGALLTETTRQHPLHCHPQPNQPEQEQKNTDDVNTQHAVALVNLLTLSALPISGCTPLQRKHGLPCFKDKDGVSLSGYA